MRKRVPREYQELFCVGELTEMEKRLYGGDPYRERVGGMHYCTKTEKAGDTLVLTVYPILGRSDRAKAEAARKAREEEERKAAEAARKTQEEAAKAMARQQTQNAQQAQQKNDKVQGSSQGQSSSSFGSNTTAKPQTVSNGQAVVNYAAQFVGNPYVYGGSSLTNGADCSGFVMSVYQAFGISLPHSSSALRSVGYGVSLDAIQPGDIVCYSGHVGIYAGNNTLLHASSPSTGIKYTSPVTYREILAIRRIF